MLVKYNSKLVASFNKLWTSLWIGGFVELFTIGQFPFIKQNSIFKMKNQLNL